MTASTELSAGDAIFRPVRSGNAFEETVERLLQSIRLGVVGVGDRLPPERELAARLGVGRVTLRDAIRVLQDEGYVTSKRGRYGGTFVRADLPTNEAALLSESGGVEDALTLREVLEVGAAERAARRGLAPEHRRHLRASLRETTEAGPDDYRRKDSRLHLAIAEVAGSASLVTAVADVRTTLNALLDAIPLLERNIEHSDEQHRAIVQAILSGDPQAARRTTMEHLDGTAALLRGFLT